MPLASLTKEKADALQGDFNRVKAELSELEVSTEFGMWKRELEKLRGRITFIARKGVTGRAT